jgi:hypothetical protein
MYVFCTCRNFDKSLMKRFGGACVEITDDGQYFETITVALDERTSDGIRRISGFQLSPCQYVERAQTWPNAVPYDPVFRKPPAYAHQAEVRAAWASPVTSLVPINLIVPAIRRWCRRIA